MYPSPKIRALLYASAIVIGVALPCSALAGGSDVTMERSVEMALARSPEIQIASKQTQQAGYSVDEAKAGYYPRVDVFAQTGREYNDPASFRGGTIATGTSNTNMSSTASFSVNQPVFRGFQTQEEIRRRKQLVESSEIQAVQVQEQIILSTVDAYLRVLQSQQAVADAAMFVQTMEDIFAKLVLMVEIGAESDAKLKFVNARIQNARQQKISIEAQLSDALNDLELLTGPTPPFEALHPLENFSLGTLETYFQQAQDYNKELQINKSDRQALAHQLEAVKGQYYPTLDAVFEVRESKDVGGEIGHNNNASGMLQMNYNLFDGFARNASKNRVLSQIQEIDITIEKLTRDINQHIKLLYNQLQSLEREWYSVDQEITANDELRGLNQEQFELGEGNILELVESEERYFDSKIKKYRVEFDYTSSIFNLYQKIGVLNQTFNQKSAR